MIAGPFSELACALGLPEGEISYRPRADGGRDEIAAEADPGRAPRTSGAPTLLRAAARRGRAPLPAGPFRRFGSQGHSAPRSLALLFAERGALIEAGRPAPLMFLDDVMSQLDPATATPDLVCRGAARL